MFIGTIKETLRTITATLTVLYVRVYSHLAEVVINMRSFLIFLHEGFYEVLPRYKVRFR